jgi:hypothetical protein
VTDSPPPASLLHGEVPMLGTPLGELELAAVLRDAHHFTRGDFPSSACLSVAWAQCAFEHAHGRAIWCHNIGNITNFGWHEDYYTIHFKPGTNPTDPPVMKFRAHDDFIDGARDYWHLITTLYAGALSFFDVGDAMGAVHALKMHRYFTGDETTYKNACSSLVHYFNAHVLPSL